MKFSNFTLEQLSNAALKILFGVFFAALLFHTPFYIQDYLTNAGWVYLAALVFFISFLLSFRDQIFVPKRSVLILVGVGALALFFSSLLNHSTFLEERWTQRYLGILFFIIAFQIFKTELDISKYLKIPLSVFLLFVCSESIYQYLFRCQLNDPLGPSCYASRLWNINMLSQALVLSLPFLLIFRKNTSNKIAGWGFEAIVVLSSVTILLTGCRSSMLALGLFYFLQLVAPFSVSRRRSILLLVASATLFTPLYLHKQNTLAPLGEGKKGSAQYRLEVWKKTIEMAKDFPNGVGVNNFEFGFLPYKRESKIPNVTQEVDKSPHNEFMRVLAEEGWIVFFGLIVLVGASLLAALKQLRDYQLKLFSRFILIGLPEFFFQFPTEMIFPVFLFCICCAVTLNSTSIKVVFRPAYKAIVILFTGVVLTLFILRNSQTVSSRYSAEYCTLFPDNWKMCGEYFKANFDAGRSAKASATIRPIIRRQPFNFIALNFDYLLGDEVSNNAIACNYFSLFNGLSSIEGSDTRNCNAGISRRTLIENFQSYARERK